MLETADGAVFTVVLGAGGDAVPVVVLHGFPTSSWDFAAAAERVAAERPVLLFDFLGFGWSDKPAEHGYSLFEQADAACAVVAAAGHRRVHLWAHDMGTSVAAELLARRERGLLPFEVASLTLMNGSVHVEMASPTIAQRILLGPAGPTFARLSSRAVFFAQMRRVFARTPSDAELEGMWTLLCRADGRARLPQIIGYMRERARFRSRWIGALGRLDVPTLVAWGRKDPVAVVAIAERLGREIPGATVTYWPELGHYPQMEDPATVAVAVADFVSAREQL